MHFVSVLQDEETNFTVQQKGLRRKDLDALPEDDGEASFDNDTESAGTTATLTAVHLLADSRNSRMSSNAEPEVALRTEEPQPYSAQSFAGKS